MSTEKELAAAQERVAALELEQALAGFDPVSESRVTRQPGTGGQSPTNQLAIQKLEQAEAEADARSRAAAPDDREAVVDYLSAGQAPDSQAFIRQTVR